MAFYSIEYSYSQGRAGCGHDIDAPCDETALVRFREYVHASYKAAGTEESEDTGTWTLRRDGETIARFPKAECSMEETTNNLRGEPNV